MATQKQIHANRANAQLSTGPRTEQGKAVSRMNALKSGIDARNDTAAGEDHNVLEELTAHYNHEFQPMGVVERVLVDILIQDDWFLRRNRFLAADLVNHSANIAFESRKGADHGHGYALNTESFHRLHRQIADTKKSYFTHLAELERRQALRRQHQPEVDAPVTDSPQTENPVIGFVSQNTAQNTPEPSEPAARCRPTFGFVPPSVNPPRPVNIPTVPWTQAQPRYTEVSPSDFPKRPWLK